MRITSPGPINLPSRRASDNGFQVSPCPRLKPVREPPRRLQAVLNLDLTDGSGGVSELGAILQQLRAESLKAM